MSDFLWYLPSHGDGRDLIGSAHHLEAPTRRDRRPTLAYLRQVAIAAEYAGFSAALIPTGVHCEDAWLVASAVAQHTQRLKTLVAFRPGLMNPAVAAQSAASFQQLTGGRLILNVVTGGSAREARSYGDFLDHDARYERTGEFLAVARGVWKGPGFNFRGKHYQIEEGGLVEPLRQVPTIYFGGASEAAEKVAAEHADVYLMWGETPAMVKERIRKVRALAASHGRTIRFGIRLHVITRDTEEEAWSEAKRLLDGIPDGAIEKAQAGLGSLQSVGQARMLALRQGKGREVRDLEVYPNLWAGISLVRGGAGTALVGSHAQVEARIAEYEALGLDTFILSGYPNLEEAVRVGEDLLPRLEARTKLASSRAPVALVSES